MTIQALIFDVDGTLAETEEVHRAAFNRVFADERLDWSWDVDLYRDLLKTTGGKERMRAYASQIGAEIDDARVQRMHLAKNAHYGALTRSGKATLRPGVEILIRRGHAAGLKLAICTTTSRANIEALIEATLGADGFTLFDVIVGAEDAPVKKPAPDAYLLALERLGLPASACLAFEDSRNGLAAARAAGIATVVTPGLYTAHETFEGAAVVLPSLEGFDWRLFAD
ncbi:MAG: HAD-IA family hydrolase [Methylobacteriaceae bacterium]|nr:HAD-IA family hydrolase [Rhodoblastus sp.]MCC0004253.1 HAD-IA family hydrolase [Methylobacteriaceae bacterium]